MTHVTHMAAMDVAIVNPARIRMGALYEKVSG